jgi:uncharacterized protein YoxC
LSDQEKKRWNTPVPDVEDKASTLNNAFQAVRGVYGA